MTRSLLVGIGLAVIAGCPPNLLAEGPVRHKPFTAAQRLQVLRRAKVWRETDPKSKDLRAGPDGAGAFEPEADVTCHFVNKELGGSTPKFSCAITHGDDVKVKYGWENGEIYGEVAASRLLWALGFGADRMYPVRVICRGCPTELRPANEFVNGYGGRDQIVFPFAAIERKAEGHELEGPGGSGWSWSELDLIDAAIGGSSLAERDALKLLAVIIQHTDSKAPQQRLVCLGDRKPDSATGTCEQPFMVVSDLGKTFGVANKLNRDSVGSTNLERWSKAGVWLNRDQCVANLPKSFSGTLDNPRISEQGRAFLAGLLVQLSNYQLRDLFSVARFPLRTQSMTDESEVIDGWVAAFTQKVDQVVNTTCPKAPFDDR